MFFSKKQNESFSLSDALYGETAIDFHSHILPEMDDGCQSCDEAIEILCATYSQGIGKIVATPHFYPTEEDPQTFFKRRDIALEKLISAIEESRIDKSRLPSVCVGAEVAYFNGIANCADVNKLCICGTNLLLLELPFSEWGESIIDEIHYLQRRQEVVPVIAHIERYVTLQKKQVIEALMSSDLLIQSNASGFLNLSSRGFALRELKCGCIDILGSDAHNLTGRAQALGQAMSFIEKKLGKKVIDEIIRFGNYILNDAEWVI